MKHLLADTLFKRLFLLMWLALVLSHLAGFLTVRTLHDAQVGRQSPPRELELPTLPSLPPMGGPGPRHDRDAEPPVRGDLPYPPPRDDRQMGPMPAGSAPPLWLDYLVRVAVIGLAAWFGARWLAAPMRRLAGASRSLTQALAEHRHPAPLNEATGTLEVRQTAQVFNTMAAQLHEQFEARGLMMAAISHDLRTPLARLRLRLEMMDDETLKQRCVADVQEADQLIASVLDTLRLTHAAPHRERIEMRSLLQSLVDDAREQGQPVDLDLLPLERPAVVLADVSELQRAIGNLIRNAVRHGGSAHVALAESADRLLVRIDDEGPGIPEAELEAVFQPFYRVDNSRSRDTGGTGLGLYIARDLARRHGGDLTLANRRNGGLRAELSLPHAP